MKNITGYFLVSIFLLAGAGCGKSGADCFSNFGNVITQEREVSPFDSIALYDYVNVFLTQDTAYKIVVESGKNIIGGIETSVENRTLTIRNTNGCNWVRSYDKPINVYISLINLDMIYYNSSGNVTSLNTIKTDSLKVEAWGGCGRIELDLDVYSGSFYLQIGTSDIHLSGNCAILSMFTGDFGLLDARNLKSAYAFVSNKSSNDCYIQVHEELDATIESIGNIYYTGNPKKIETTINGPGSVIAF